MPRILATAYVHEHVRLRMCTHHVHVHLHMYTLCPHVHEHVRHHGKRRCVRGDVYALWWLLHGRWHQPACKAGLFLWRKEALEALEHEPDEQIVWDTY